MTDEHLGEEPSSGDSAWGGGRLLGAIGWAVAVGTAGGLACGLAVARWDEYGFVSLWALGALAGYVGRKITQKPQRLVGWMLVAACVSALLLSVVCWIRWSTEQGEEGWWAAVNLLPTFVRQYERSALIGCVFTGLGCWSAYRGVAARFRQVAID